MARTSNISFGQVAAIADAMKAAGTRPTARSVRERIGSGSMGTIHKFLSQWSGKTVEESEDVPELPESIANALMDFIGTEIATACEPIAEDARQHRAACDELAEDNERLNLDISYQDEKISELEKGWAAATAERNIAREELDAARLKIQALLTANSQLQRDYDRAMEQVVISDSVLPELRACKDQLIYVDDQRHQAEKTAAVLQAKLDAAAERDADHKQRIDDLARNNAGLAAQASTANQHYQACAARLEAAAREIDALKKKPQAAPIKKAKPTATSPTKE